MAGYVLGLPDFLIYFVSGIGLLAVFGVVYTFLTPHNELKLIRSGNVSAVMAFLGALLGFTMPLSSAATHSVNLVDFLIWSLVGLVMQLFAFGIACLTFKGLSKAIDDNNHAAGAWAGGIGLLVGLINAASMSF